MLLQIFFVLVIGNAVVESRFEDIFMPRQNSQFFNFESTNITWNFDWFRNFQSIEVYEYLVGNEVLQIPNVTKECIEDLELISLVLLNRSSAYPGLDQIVSQMKDATAQIPSGLLRGPAVLYGFKQECDVIKYTVPNRNREFQNAYSRAFLTPSGDCTKSIGFDFCLPKICSSTDLMNIVESVKQLFPNVTIPLCTITTFNDVNEPLSTGSWIMISFFIALALLGISAGIVDYFLVPKTSSIRKKTGAQAFLAFSLYTNISEILRAPKIKKGQIGAINCIRVISMFWVMLGHCIEVFVNIMNNALDFISLLDYPLTQIVENAYFAVDSFFFIGGVLLSFMWFKAFEKDKRTLTSPNSWIMFYVHRFIRLSAPYYVVYLTYAYLYHPIIQDMPVYLIPNPPQENQCQKYWWKNLLYFTNLIDVPERCMGHIWYLATDMQMFVITPILLIPMAINPIFGISVAAILIFLSTAGNVITVYLNHYPPTLLYFGPTDPETKNLNLYNINIYNAMWIRCQIYIMGILVGWMLQRFKKIRIHPLINLIGWALSLALMLTVVFGLFHYFRGHQLPLFWRAAYSALSKPAWGLGLSWIIISCYYGYGGPINQFMSWNIWVPLGRLSYCAYLVHVPIIIYIFGLGKNSVYFSSIWQILANYFFTTLVVSFGMALMLSALVEVPAGKLESLLLKDRVKPKPENPENWETSNGSVKIKL